MRYRLMLIAVLSALAALAAVSATTATAAAGSSQLSIIGPWQGADAASFEAVLKSFTDANPGVTVAYRPATGDVAAALPTSDADLAVLPLPADRSAMTTLARNGTLKSLDFAAPSVAKNYAYSWKLLGSVDGRLTGLFFKATDLSAFWYDTSAFKNLGLSVPTTWAQLGQLVQKIRANGLAPFAVSGGDSFAVPNLFQNIYLTFEGNRAYDKLASGALSWHDSTVYGSLANFRRMFGQNIAGGVGALSDTYLQAVKKVFGSPMKAYLVPGGSAVLPVLASSNAVRPLSKFGVFPFPESSAKSAPRVIGDGDAVVMTKDSPAAQALVNYLATPAAAEIWAKRGGDFLSPNENVPASAYAIPQMATLARAVESATTFRFPLADLKPAPFRKTLDTQLDRYLRTPSVAGDVVARIAIAAGESK